MARFFWLTDDIDENRYEFDLFIQQHPRSNWELLNTVPFKEVSIGSEPAVVRQITRYMVLVRQLPRKFVVGYNVERQEIKIDIARKRLVVRFRF